jgi:hypothetical protein
LIEIIAKEAVENADLNHLFFINLGGYKENEFEEYHYKILTVAQSMGLASKRPRRVLYKHCGFKGAGVSHIDDKYGSMDDLIK